MEKDTTIINSSSMSVMYKWKASGRSPLYIGEEGLDDT
jgi:hypothetical protein